MTTNSTSSAPLIQVRNLERVFKNGDQEVKVLKGISFEISAGEMVAIIGQSGSGKSTLLNLLGCLDDPSSGEYLIDGVSIGGLDTEEKAKMRRENIGFIFQSYHLLKDFNARENVALPAIYSGVSTSRRLARADELLGKLGLSTHVHHRQNQLSGGQQQRVSIARALMNGGMILLADEPTGALDSQSGEDVMQILEELHEQGHTVILVTHDLSIADRVDRVIELRDGVLIRDEGREQRDDSPVVNPPFPKTTDWRVGRFAATCTMAWKAINGHKLRALLTMLGIIIGIASVVTVVALGQGSQERILSGIRGLGTSTIHIYPGAHGGRSRWRTHTLVPSDADFLAKQSFVASATPVVNRSGTFQYGNQDLETGITGVGSQYFDVQGMKLTKGRQLLDEDITELASVGYIDTKSAKTVFGDEDPIGKIVLVNSRPIRLIGVIDSSTIRQYGGDSRVSIWMPYTSVMGRITNRGHLSSIIVRIPSSVEVVDAEQAIKKVLSIRHGSEDFSTFNSDSVREAVTETVQTMSLLISAIALISLIVGGVGVMNIMLVSVTERTAEIGIRRAVGARGSDILIQFLIESTLLCAIGGLNGLLLAYGIGYIVEKFPMGITMIYSQTSVIFAFACSTGIGILFGYLPARSASKLNPVDALARN